MHDSLDVYFFYLFIFDFFLLSANSENSLSIFEFTVYALSNLFLKLLNYILFSFTFSSNTFLFAIFDSFVYSLLILRMY